MKGLEKEGEGGRREEEKEMGREREREGGEKEEGLRIHYLELSPSFSLHSKLDRHLAKLSYLP